MKFLKNPNSLICIIAVLAISLLCQSGQVSNPGLPYMMQEYSSISPATVTMVATLPSLAMIVCSVLYPILRRYMPLRPIVVVAGILLVVFGVAPIWTQNFTAILVERFLFGMGVGFMWPAVQSSIVELYTGTKRDTLLGFNSVLTAFGGIIWANTAGPLALNGWRASYYAYFIALVIIIFVVIFLPVTKAMKNSGEPAPAEGEEAVDLVEVPPADFKFGTAWAWALIIVSFVFNLCSATFFTNVSSKVILDGLGTSVQAGLGLTAWTAGSVVVGLLFGLIMKAKIMDRYGCAIGWVVTGIGILIAAHAQSMPVLLLGGAIGGIGCGTFVPAQVGVLGKLAGTKKASTYVSAALAIGGIAQFFGPPLLTAIAQAQGLDAGAPTLNYGGWTMLISGIVVLIFFIIAFAMNKKKAAE